MQFEVVEEYSTIQRNSWITFIQRQGLIVGGPCVIRVLQICQGDSKESERLTCDENDNLGKESLDDIYTVHTLPSVSIRTS